MGIKDDNCQEHEGWPVWDHGSMYSLASRREMGSQESRTTCEEKGEPGNENGQRIRVPGKQLGRPNRDALLGRPRLSCWAT